MTQFRTRDDIYTYFLDMDRDGHHTLEKLRAAFEAMWTIRLSAKQTAVTLYKTALYIGKKAQAGHDVEDLRDIVRVSLRPWMRNARERMALNCRDPMSAWDLSNCVWAFARLGLHPGESYLDAWSAAFKSSAQRGLSAMETSSTLWAMASLGIHPGAEGMDNLIDSAAHKIRTGQFDGQAMANSAWALAVLHILSPCQKAFALAHDLLDQHRHSQDNHVKGQTQTAQARAYFRYGDLKSLSYRETGTVSHRESYVAKVFRTVSPDIRVSTQDRIQALSHRPDMVISQGGRRAIVEYDGPYHFVGRRPNGGTILMSALMEDHCPDASIVRLPYWVCDNWLEKGVACKKPVQDFMAAALERPPGACIFNDAEGFAPLFAAHESGGRQYAYTH